jgi:mono/diheme cytochrome c family protein
MTGEEERLYARAEMLDETGELGQAVAEVLAGAQGAGVDPRAVISLTAALQALEPGTSPGYSAGSQKDRQGGTGYGSDGEFLEALSDAEDQVREHLREMKAVQEQVSLALDRAQDDLGQARRDLAAAKEALAAAYAMPTREPCDGCHRARAAAIAAAEAAIADAEARIADAERRIAIREAAADILGPLAERLARTARSTSSSISSSVPGGSCPGTVAGSKERAREAAGNPPPTPSDRFPRYRVKVRGLAQAPPRAKVYRLDAGCYKLLAASCRPAAYGVTWARSTWSRRPTGVHLRPDFVAVDIAVGHHVPLVKFVPIGVTRAAPSILPEQFPGLTAGQTHVRWILRQDYWHPYLPCCIQ